MDPDQQDCDTHLPTDHSKLHFKKPKQTIFLILVYSTSEKIKKAFENPEYFQMRLKSLGKHLHTKKNSLSVNFRAYSSETQSDPDERGILNTFYIETQSELGNQDLTLLKRTLIWGAMLTASVWGLIPSLSGIAGSACKKIK
jgi:hypothetical protein